MPSVAIRTLPSSWNGLGAREGAAGQPERAAEQNNRLGKGMQGLP